MASKPDWFASCLEANKVNNPADRWQGSEAPSRPVMRALALVRAGQVWESVLTPLNDEELLGFDFDGYPTDFYSLEVQAVMTTDEPFLLSEGLEIQIRSGGRWGCKAKRARLHCHFFSVDSAFFPIHTWHGHWGHKASPP